MPIAIKDIKGISCDELRNGVNCFDIPKDALVVTNIMLKGMSEVKLDLNREKLAVCILCFFDKELNAHPGILKYKLTDAIRHNFGDIVEVVK